MGVIGFFTFTETLEWFEQGLGPYSASIKKAEKEIKEMAKKVNDLCGMFSYANYEIYQSAQSTLTELLGELFLYLCLLES